MLLTVFAVIAASLLGGCSDNIIGVIGPDAAAVARSPVLSPAGMPTAHSETPALSNRDMKGQLASAALDDAKLSNVRGGYDSGSGVTLNFAFQQATFVNHNLTENVVIPTLTISPGQAGTAVAGGAAAQLAGTVGSLGAFGIAGGLPSTSTSGVSTATIVANNSVQTQVSVSNSTLQALVNSGLARVIGGGASAGGLTSVLANTANNQLIQQQTTIDIGVSGLSSMMHEGVASAVLGRLTGPALR